ncbi:MAG: hypothetical protein ACREFR_02430, partial [Limisphaerales bacterium]
QIQGLFGLMNVARGYYVEGSKGYCPADAAWPWRVPTPRLWRECFAGRSQKSLSGGQRRSLGLRGN